MATSITPTIQGTVLQFTGTGFDATRVFNPQVVLVGGEYAMLFGGLPFGNNEQIGLATSSDEINWTQSVSNPVISNAGSPSWASVREVPAALMYENGVYELWFNGDNSNLSSDPSFGSGFGYATSTDGINWTINPNPIRFASGSGFDLVGVVKLGSQYDAYYTTGGILYEAMSNDGFNFTNDTQVNAPQGYSLQALTTTTVGGIQELFAIWQDSGGVDHYAVSTDGVNFTIEGNVNLPSGFGVNDVRIANGQIQLFGTVGVGNVNWSFGNEVIQYATAPLPSFLSTLPTVSSITAATDNGFKELDAGHVVTITVSTSEAVYVTGIPALQLNNNEIAGYSGGTGTSTLTFTYTVQKGDDTSDLQVTGLAPNGATIQDIGGNNLSGLVVADFGIEINTVDPIVTGVSTSPSTGDFKAGETISIFLTLSEPVKVKGGAPTLTLNDGGVAHYQAAASQVAFGFLVFSYKVGAGQNTSDLMIAGVNANLPSEPSVMDAAGHPVDFSNALTAPLGVQVDTTPPTIMSVVASGTGITDGDGDLGVGRTVTLTVTFSEVVNVDTSGGIPALNLNDGGKAIYKDGSGTNALTFTYTVAAKENTPDLAVNGLVLNGGSIEDGAGNNAVLSGAKGSLTGILQIDGNAPVVKEHLTDDTGVSHTDLITSNDSLTGSGDPNAIVRFTVDGAAIAATATADSTGRWTFTPSDLPDGQHTVVASETDDAGNTGTASLTFTLDTMAPTVSNVTVSMPTGDTLNTGNSVAIVLLMNEPVVVANSATPTLKLSNGGVAIYDSSTSNPPTRMLSFDYTVSSSETQTYDLQLIQLSASESIRDLAGNPINADGAASLSGFNLGLQVGNTTGQIVPTYAEKGSNGATDYYDEEGGSLIQINSGGTVSWRNNNPTNLTYAGQPTAIGSYYDSAVNLTFCIFPNYSTGVEAAVEQLEVPLYQRETIDEAIQTWTNDPIGSNNLLTYQTIVDNALGLPGSTMMDTLTQAQLHTMVTQGMRVAEQWTTGQGATFDGSISDNTSSTAQLVQAMASFGVIGSGTTIMPPAQQEGEVTHQTLTANVQLLS
jgi:hypothetical protein